MNRLGWRLYARAALLALALTCALAAGAAPVATDDPSALAVVTTTVDAVLAALADQSLNEDTRRRQVKKVIAKRFDFAAMSSRVLATNWAKADREQRARFINLFRELLSNTYWSRIAGYTNEKVQYLGEKSPDGKLATVNTVIRTDSVDIPVDYKLYHSSRGWLAYDVVIEQVSLVRNYRGSFQDIVREHGIEGLLRDLETRVAASSAPAQPSDTARPVNAP